MFNFLPISAIKRNFLAILFLGLLTFCSSDPSEDTNEPAPSSNIILNNAELKSLQAATVSVNEFNLSQDEYYGMLGDQEILFKKVNEHTLALLVPVSVPQGSHKIILDIDGKNFEMNVTIARTEEITSPTAVFNDYHQELSNNSYYNLTETQLAMIKADFESLDEAEKMEAAIFIKNNKQALDQLRNALMSFETTTESLLRTSADCNSLCVVGAGVAVIGAALSAPVVLAVGAGVLVGLVAEKMVKLIKPLVDDLLPKVNKALEIVYGLGYNRMAYVTELIYDEAENMITNKTSEMPSEIRLSEDQNLNLDLQLVKTPFVSVENKDEFPIVGELLRKIDHLTEKLEGYFELKQPKTEEYLEYGESLEDFSISIDNDDVEMSELKGSVESAYVSFKTDKIEEQEFTFTYTYDNGEDEPSSFSQKVILEVKPIKVVKMDGGVLSNPVELVNSVKTHLKLVNDDGVELEDFAFEKLDIRNVSTEDVYVQIQSTNDYEGSVFELIPLTDYDDIDVNFKIYYDDVLISEISANIRYFGCGDLTEFMDPRDGKIYSVVTIGNQCWFAENLNYDKDESWCYNDNSANCEIYGRLYTWQAAFNACPDGWHLPSDEEWSQLTEYLGGESIAGEKIRSGAFSGLLGGYRNEIFSEANFLRKGGSGYFWSSTTNNYGYDAFYRQIYESLPQVSRGRLDSEWGMSCRCIKD